MSTTRRDFLKMAGVGAAALAMPAWLRSGVHAAPGKQPNVLFFAIDDLNHWVGYLARNAQTRTPNIDRLAKRGVWFTHSYCPAPVCNASRAALMSGLRPGSTGVYDNNNDWRTVIPEDLPLTTTFRKAGYSVLGAGKIYHGSYDRRGEFDDYLAKEGTGVQVKPAGSDGVGGIKFGVCDCRDEDISDYHIINYGIEQLRKKHEKPLFLAVGLHKPHMPWYVPRKYFEMHPLDKIELPPHREDDLKDVPAGGIKMARPEGDHAEMLKSGRWKEAVQAYLATISYCDAQVGRLMDAFDQSAYRDNTIVCFWSDHGWHLGEKSHWRKFALWEESTRAPFIWVVPGLTKADARCDRPVDFMSIYPTLTDLCGIPTPKHVEGANIRPLLANAAAPWETPAVTTYKFNNHTVRTESWRYTRYSDGGEELYDHAKDPYEWTNVADRPENTARKAELARWLPKENKPDIGGGGKAAAGRAGAGKKGGGKKQQP